MLDVDCDFVYVSIGILALMMIQVMTLWEQQIGIADKESVRRIVQMYYILFVFLLS